MRIVAAFPAIGLLAGCGLGLYGPDIPRPFLAVLLLPALIGSIAAIWRQTPTVLVPAIAVGFAAGGVLLTSQAWEAARHSTLALVFDSIVRSDRREAIRQGRTIPEESGAAVVVDGVLTADASASSSGV